MWFTTNYQGMEKVCIDEDHLSSLKSGMCFSWHNYDSGEDSPFMKIINVDMDNNHIDMEIAEFKLETN